jgi:biotin-(acetyl-CoA carboxylase) ligase
MDFSMPRDQETTRETVQIGLRFLEGNQISSSFDRETIVILRSTDSTMDDIDRLIDPEQFQKNAARYGDLNPGPNSAFVLHGTTIIALEQTKGRGTTDAATGKVRDWWSGAGNLMFSRVVDGIIPPNEIECVSGLAIAEIIADLLPRAVVSIKFPNDILVDGKKISGCLMSGKYQMRSNNQQSQKVNLGVGVNLAKAPPMSKMRDGSAVAATCLQDHGANIGIAEFFSRFDAKFEELLDYRVQHGFTAILKRIGFADAHTGIVTLYEKTDNTPISGDYCGVSAERYGAGTTEEPFYYVSFIHLRNANGETLVLPYQSYKSSAVIKGQSMLGPHHSHTPSALINV